MLHMRQQDINLLGAGDHSAVHKFISNDLSIWDAKCVRGNFGKWLPAAD